MDIARAAGLPIKAARVGASSLDSVAAFVAKRTPNSAMSTGPYTRLTSIEPMAMAGGLYQLSAPEQVFQLRARRCLMRVRTITSHYSNL